jgi:hypothetical protein
MAGAWCVVRGASAQDLDSLRRRADSLGDAWREAQMLATLQDSLRRTAPPPNMERFEDGALTVLADPSHLPLKQAVRDAWQQLDAFYGDAAAALAGRPIVVRVLTPQQTRRPGHGERFVLATDDLTAAQLTTLLVRNAPFAPADRALHAWLSAAFVPPADSVRERATVYVDMVTAPASISQWCFGGDIAACRTALGLSPAPRPVLDWWTAGDRRRLVPVLLEDYYLRSPEHRPVATACLEGGVDSACVQLLESIPRAALPPALGAMARLTLVQLALARGGRGAYARLLADSSATIAERLAAASGMTPDSLVAAWQRAVVASRPNRVAMRWLTGVVVIGWIGVLTTCALRSTRWRL